MNTQKTFKILSIEAWADGEDGWYWNNWNCVGELEDETLLDNGRNEELIAWFIQEGYLKETAKDLVYVDDDQYNLVITHKDSHEPIYAVEYGNNY